MSKAIIYLDPDSELNLQAQIRQKLVYNDYSLVINITIGALLLGLVMIIASARMLDNSGRK